MSFQTVVLVLSILYGIVQSQQVPGGQCIPFQLPSQFNDFGQLCDYLSDVSGADVERAFSAGRLPPPIQAGGRPLAGCTIGCPISNSIETRSSLFMLESWSGKCFTEFQGGFPTKARNIITPAAAERSWASGVDGTLGFGGDVSVTQNSWFDRRPALVLDYTDVPPEQSFLFIDFNEFLDEIREVAPGMAIGKVWTKPNTSMNPGFSPLPGAWFALFQVCTVDGRYPQTPGERVVTRTTPRPTGLGALFGSGGKCIPLVSL
mmetsp:Transcript_19746/g.47128  ORF Transcript_19746/g.47128 Transcript_19746/m.47128 type:complete len:261 (+) Transcript_19746:132-914(+)